MNFERFSKEVNSDFGLISLSATIVGVKCFLKVKFKPEDFLIFKRLSNLIITIEFVDSDELESALKFFLNSNLTPKKQADIDNIALRFQGTPGKF